MANGFIDKARITVRAGNGGNGAVAFHREKYIAAGGPDGGDGGNGGSIILRVDDNMSTLMDFRYKRKYVAGNGVDGQGGRKTGKDGESLTIKVPRGTLVRDAESGEIIKDMSDDAPFVLCKGGRGGWGNQHFATPTRQVPRFAKAGLPGESHDVILELKLLADVGLVGFPNVGKSTLLSVVSKAHPKIANYHPPKITTRRLPQSGRGGLRGRGRGHRASQDRQGRRYPRHAESGEIIKDADDAPFVLCARRGRLGQPAFRHPHPSGAALCQGRSARREPRCDFRAEAAGGSGGRVHAAQRGQQDPKIATHGRGGTRASASMPSSSRERGRGLRTSCGTSTSGGRVRQRGTATINARRSWWATRPIWWPTRSRSTPCGSTWRRWATSFSPCPPPPIRARGSWCSIAQRLSELPPVTVYEPEYVPKPPVIDTSEPLHIEREDNTWLVEGPWLQRLMGNINFSDYESRMYFDKMLRQSGLFDTLEQMGIQDGDIVSMYDLEFEYQR